ncbi:MAG: hypothetical protein ACRBHB_24745 [Arenicella sp.]
MSDKTPNQLALNEKLTSLLNTDGVISNFNIFSIDLLNKNLASIQWDKQFKQSPNKNAYWFFVKGGTALRLIFEQNGQNDLMPAPSDWDTQIVINPDYDFELWYKAYGKIEEAVNNTLIMANMAFTMLPDISNQVTTTIPDECNNMPLIANTWHGEVKYRESADKKTVYLYKVFHPLQPSDMARQSFAHIPHNQWADSGEKQSLFDELFPRETLEFNQLQYRTLQLWINTYKALNEFIDSTGWPLTDEQRSKIIQTYNLFYWSMQRVTDTNKADAIQWSNAFFNTALNNGDSVQTVQQTLDTEYKKLQKKPVLLGSGQQTLIIDEFYLFRLVVRYKYHKPVPPVPNLDYRKEWTASGNLRGELIDVTVPRRDTYEAKHHGIMLDKGIWVVENISKKLSDVDGVEAVLLPVLSSNYQITEQILIIREILAGKSSSPTKIRKRLERGYALANAGSNNDAGRLKARKDIIDIFNQQFTSTYQPFANAKVNELIQQYYGYLLRWSEPEIPSEIQAETALDDLKRSFDIQCLESKNNLEKTLLSQQQLDGLTTFVRDVTSIENYRNVWGTDQTNAGMLDFFMISTIYAQIASRIQMVLSGRSLDLSIRKPRRVTDARELIKYFCATLSNNPNIYPQVAGRAASYYHLKELYEVFNEVDTKLKVDTIELKAIRFFPGELSLSSHLDIILKALYAIGNTLVHFGQIVSFEVNYTMIESVNFYTLDIHGATEQQTYMRVELISEIDSASEQYQTEYAYGLPVTGLNDLINELQYQIVASEFLQSQKVSAELKMLQQALSIREHARHSNESNIPPLKRRLSISDIAKADV